MKKAKIYFEGTLVETIDCTGVDYICREDSILLFLIDKDCNKSIVAVVPNTHLIIVE